MTAAAAQAVEPDDLVDVEDIGWMFHPGRDEWQRYGFGDWRTVSEWTQAGFSAEDAMDYTSVGLSPKEAAPWRDAGIRSATAASWIEQNVSPVLAASLISRGLSCMGFRYWRQHQFTTDEIDDWTSHQVTSPSEAMRFIDHGFDSVTAEPWVKIKVDARQARQWCDRGTDPDEVVRWAEFLRVPPRSINPDSVETLDDVGVNPDTFKDWSEVIDGPITPSGLYRLASRIPLRDCQALHTTGVDIVETVTSAAAMQQVIDELRDMARLSRPHEIPRHPVPWRSVVFRRAPSRTDVGRWWGAEWEQGRLVGVQNDTNEPVWVWSTRSDNETARAVQQQGTGENLEEHLIAVGIIPMKMSSRFDQARTPDRYCRHDRRTIIMRRGYRTGYRAGSSTSVSFTFFLFPADP